MNSDIYRNLYYVVIAGNWDMAKIIAEFFKENHKLDEDCDLYSIEFNQSPNAVGNDEENEDTTNKKTANLGNNNTLFFILVCVIK